VPVRAWRFKSSHPHSRFEPFAGPRREQTTQGRGTRVGSDDREVEQQDLIGEVFGERDSFRLAIRGMVLIEELLDEAIDGAFREGMPPELARINRRR
jgi:hypothetical protein